MESAIFDIKDKIDSLEFVIDTESNKLLEFQELLREIQTSVEVPHQKDTNRIRDKEIDKARKRLNSLTAECKALLKDIAATEQNEVDLDPPDVQKMRSKLDQMDIEISMAENEFYELEKMIENIKESNIWLEKDIGRKLEMLESDFNKMEEVGVLELKSEETEAANNLEILKDNLKKAKLQLNTLKNNVSTMQIQCKAEQKKNEDIESDVWELRKMQEKINHEKRLLHIV